MASANPVTGSKINMILVTGVSGPDRVALGEAFAHTSDYGAMTYARGEEFDLVPVEWARGSLAVDPDERTTLLLRNLGAQTRWAAGV